MLRHIFLLFTSSLLALTVISCSSKDKKDSEDMGGTPEASIEEKPMQFDPMGSDSGNISGLGSVFFEYDQSTLTSAAKQVLSENASWIKNNSNVTVQVEGHCDERGSIEYNLSLGERRAKAVKNYLVNLGVDASKLTIISYGEEKPLVRESNESAWAKNRRANFVPLPSR